MALHVVRAPCAVGNSVLAALGRRSGSNVAAQPGWAQTGSNFAVK